MRKGRRTKEERKRLLLETLRAIEAFELRGFPPSLEDLAEALGMFPSGIRYRLKLLSELNLIETGYPRARCLKLSQKGRDLLGRREFTNAIA